MKKIIPFICIVFYFPIVFAQQELSQRLRDDLDPIGANNRRANELKKMRVPCKWIDEIPRTIVKSPACGRTPNDICFGYVVCEKHPLKFIKKVSCAAEFCKKGSEQRCIDDNSFALVRPDDVDNESISREVENVIKSKASAQ
jgi:hypothetical protein